MTWVMKPGALKYFRESAALSLKELRRATKVAESTIARLQSEPHAVTRGDTLQRLAKALGRETQDLATWTPAARPPVLGSSPFEDEQAQPLAAPPSLSAVSDRTKPPPALGTLSQGAAWERGRGVARATVPTPMGEVPLLGFEQFKAAFSAPKVFHGQRFVVMGVPDDYSGSHTDAAKALDSDPGVAMRFRLVRVVQSARATCPIRFYATVYTGAEAHAAKLAEAVHAQAMVTLLTRLIYRRRTFALFEAPAGRPRDLAFLVEDVLPAPPSALRKPQARREDGAGAKP